MYVSIDRYCYCILSLQGATYVLDMIRRTGKYARGVIGVMNHG